MNGMKTEEAGSRKKYLAPLVVIMLCLVALTGAAYAYSSTVSIGGNQIDAKYLSLDLTEGSVGSDVHISEGNVFQFTDDFVYSGATKTDKVTCTVATRTITYDLTITGDLACHKLKVQSSNIANILNTPIGAYKLSQMVTVKVGLTDNAAAATELSVNDTDLVFDCEKAADTPSKDQNVYVFIVGKAASFVVQDTLASTEDDYHISSYYANLANLNFNLKFTAADA